MSAPVQFTPEILRFCRQPEMCEALAKLLKEPVMQQALSALATLTRPDEMPAQVAGVHHDTTIAHAYHRIRGAQLVLTMLGKMTAIPTDTELAQAAAEEMFTEGLPKELQTPPKK